MATAGKFSYHGTVDCAATFLIKTDKIFKDKIKYFSNVASQPYIVERMEKKCCELQNLAGSHLFLGNVGGGGNLLEVKQLKPVGGGFATTSASFCFTS